MWFPSCPNLRGVSRFIQSVYLWIPVDSLTYTLVIKMITKQQYLPVLGSVLPWFSGHTTNPESNKPQSIQNLCVRVVCVVLTTTTTICMRHRDKWRNFLVHELTWLSGSIMLMMLVSLWTVFVVNKKTWLRRQWNDRGTIVERPWNDRGTTGQDVLDESSR